MAYAASLAAGLLKAHPELGQMPTDTALHMGKVLASNMARKAAVERLEPGTASFPLLGLRPVFPQISFVDDNIRPSSNKVPQEID